MNTRSIALVFLFGCLVGCAAKPNRISTSSGVYVVQERPQLPDAEAEARPTSLVMKSRSHMNMYFPPGATGDSSSSRVRLSFVTATRVRVEDSGLRSQYTANMGGVNASEDVTWTNVWVGSWKRHRGWLTLKLRSKTRRCARHKVDQGRKTQPACPAGPARVVVKCRKTTVKLAVGQAALAWKCSAAKPKLGTTPMPWVFGHDRCLTRVEFTNDDWSPRYEACGKG